MIHGQCPYRNKLKAEVYSDIQATKMEIEVSHNLSLDVKVSLISTIPKQAHHGDTSQKCIMSHKRTEVISYHQNIW